MTLCQWHDDQGRQCPALATAMRTFRDRKVKQVCTAHEHCHNAKLGAEIIDQHMLALSTNAERIERMRKDQRQRQETKALEAFAGTKRACEEIGYTPDDAEREAIKAVFRLAYMMATDPLRYSQRYQLGERG